MPGEFTLGETTLGDTLPAVAGLPASATLGASALLDRQLVKARWGERYTSDAVNKKFVGFPRGVYYGFVPSTIGLELSLKPDISVSFTARSGAPIIGEVITGGTSSATANIRVISSGFFLIDTLFGSFQIGETITGGTTSFTAEVTNAFSDGISFARVTSNTPTVFGRNEHTLDVMTTDTVKINFTGFIDGTYFIFVTGSYKIGSTTIATVQSRTTPPPNLTTEVLVCVVTKVSSDLSVQATAPNTRQEPFAGTGQRVGFMPGGSIESLLAASNTTDEVIASREGTDGTVADVFDISFPQTTGLPDRLRDDLSRESMSGRLGKRIVSVRGNDHPVATPVLAGTTINVSGSFSARSRDHQPFRDVTNEDLPSGVPVPIGLSSNASDVITLTITLVSGSFSVGEVLIGATSGAKGIIRAATATTIDLDELIGVFQDGETVDSAGPPAGSATLVSVDFREGAITAFVVGIGGDAVRNLVPIVDTFTGRKPVDEDGNIIYGRLLFGPDGVSFPGGGDPGELLVATGAETVTFVQGSPTVTNTGLNFTNHFLPGDLIEGADGRFYEIDPSAGSVTSTSLTLTTGKEYLGTNASVGGGAVSPNDHPIRRRRFELKFVSLASGSEADKDITPGTTIPSGAALRPFFPCWLSGAQSNYDAHFELRAPGDAYGLAQETIPGVAYNAPGDGGAIGGIGLPVIGSIRTIQKDGLTVGNGNFHTINFTDGNVTSPSPGVIRIEAAGPPGAPGTGGAGDPGPIGPTGEGYSTIFPYQTRDIPLIINDGAEHIGTSDFTFPGVVHFFMVNSATRIVTGDNDQGWITNVVHTVGSDTITVHWAYNAGGGGSGNSQIMIIGASAAG